MRVNGIYVWEVLNVQVKGHLHKGSVKRACERTFTYGKCWRNVQVNAPLRKGSSSMGILTSNP